MTMSNTLLLVDKDRDYLQAMAAYIERLLFDVYQATTSSETQHMVDFHAPDYIVADPDLPDADGIHFLLKLKSQFPQTLFIILSEEKRLDEIMHRLQLNAFSYIRKPVNSKELEFSLLQAKEWHKQQEKINRYADRLGALHKATSLYHQLFDEIPCYISVQNKQYRITATNNLFKKHFGDAIGEYCYKAYKHRNSPCPECPVFKTFQDGRYHTTEEVVTSKDGQQYNVITWTAPIQDDETRITQVIEMSANITQIRQLQNHLESLGMMIGSMSHGVKGMLTALDGGIYQLESGIRRKDETRIDKAFQVVQEMSDRIKKMVLEILYYAKAREVNAEKISIKKFAQNIVKTVQPIADKKDVQFLATIPDDSGEFEIDFHWFQAALVNIIENSIDACEGDDCKSDYTVQFSISEKNNDMIAFHIKDNGKGMDQETQDKMFTLFFSSKGSKGTGLGLFISNHVVKEHGGRIDVSSKPGEGTTFSVFVPRSQETPKKVKGFYMLNVSAG
jgi:signal transduction histidine kinase/ActR/RegA family two-component response regulator